MTLLRLLLRLLSVLAALDAFYGLVQQLAGFPSWDLRWINSSGYMALNVGGFDRSFGSFSSSQEYAVFLASAWSYGWHCSDGGGLCG